jgi:predicted DsbA family dithiol-disulfide isomerase
VTWLAACATAPPVSESPVVGRVDGHEIRLAEIDARIRDELFAREFEGDASSLHDARSHTLESLIDETLAARAAEAAGLAPEAWLARERNTLPPVGDPEVAAFFEEHRERIPPELELNDVADQIREHLEAERDERILESLRAASAIENDLEPPRLEVAPVGPSLGPDSAPITIVEFSDYQCPYCARAEPIVRDLLRRNPRDVRVVLRHLPLDMHPRARPAAEAAVCADIQGRFWDYHGLLFAHRDRLERDDLLGYADELGLDHARFAACLDDDVTRERVDADVDAARALGVAGTPAFFVNGIPLSGAQPVERFESLIARELQREGAAP